MFVSVICIVLYVYHKFYLIDINFKICDKLIMIVIKHTGNGKFVDVIGLSYRYAVN